ncbi:MAG TPA: hypothetical protein VIM07_13285, partial [Chitinophagaceae bacterium]
KLLHKPCYQYFNWDPYCLQKYCRLLKHTKSYQLMLNHVVHLLYCLLSKDSTIGDFAMWKREIITLQGDTLKTETLNKMNEHLF